MGSSYSVAWDEVERIHRLLALAISDSTYMDPRHLEHFSYPLWNTEVAQLVAMSGRTDLMVSPQFPMWVSAVELPILPSDPNNSGHTEADGTARSVYVDFAISQPIVLPRLLKFFRSIDSLLRRMSLHTFIGHVAAGDHPIIAKLPPRCLWVDEMSAPILFEIKKPATRHPKTLQAYVRSLQTQMTDGQMQADQQGTCQFCSWRFASQQVVILVAASYDLWSCRRFMRSDAAEFFDDNECFKPDELIRRKIEMEDAGIIPPSQEVQKLMYSNPNHAAKAKKTLQEREREARDEEVAKQEQARKKLAEDRETRAVDRENKRAAPPTDDPEPNYEDRTLPLFSDQAVGRLFEEIYSTPFFETKDPQEFFVGVAATTSTQWSGALRLGTPLSNKYKQFLAEYLEDFAMKQERRRNQQFFG